MCDTNVLLDDGRKQIHGRWFVTVCVCVRLSLSLSLSLARSLARRSLSTYVCIYTASRVHGVPMCMCTHMGTPCTREVNTRTHARTRTS